MLIKIHITACINSNETYRKTSDISRTLLGNKIVDNSDVVGASPIGAAPTTSSFSTGFTGLNKNNCKTRLETFELGIQCD